MQKTFEDYDRVTTDSDSGINSHESSIYEVRPELLKSTLSTRDTTLTGSSSSILTSSSISQHRYVLQTPNGLQSLLTIVDPTPPVSVQTSPRRDYVVCQTEGETFMAHRRQQIPTWVTQLVSEIERQNL